MSFSHIANRGTVQNKTASRTLAITPSGTIAVGRLLVIWTAWDNNQGSPYPTTASFDIELMNKVTDTQGNIYIQLACQQHVGGADGVRGALYISKIRTQLTTSDTITIYSKDDGTGASDIVAKCASMHEFSMGTTGWCRYFDWDWDNWTTAQGDVPDLSVSTLDSQQYLILHMLAVEGPNTDNYTWDGDYTQITGTGTTGGAADENVHIRGGWRIATVTSDTIAITSTTADRDLTHSMILIAEVDIPSGALTFPQFSIRDAFDRANENPLGFTPGNFWLYDSGGGGWGGANPAVANATFKIVSNQVLPVLNNDDDYGFYYWNDDIPCLYGEVWATLATIPSNDIHNQSIPFPPTNPGRRGVGVSFIPAGVAGYESSLFRVGKFQVADSCHFEFPGSFFRTQCWPGRDLVNGMRIGTQMIAHRYLHTYLDENQGNGWEWLMCHDVAGIYGYNRPFRAALRMGGLNTAVDDFGGGHPCFQPDIIRRLEMPTL